MKMAAREASARLSGVQVAGKTGTAQAMTEGKKDTIAWFACFAPYDQPKYAIAVMVQGGEHGGSVAAPIATRILSRALAMDEGTYDAASGLARPGAQGQPISDDRRRRLQGFQSQRWPADDDENLDGSTNSDMAIASADPDVEPEADANGQGGRPEARPRPRPAPTPPPAETQFFRKTFRCAPQTRAATHSTPARNRRAADNLLIGT